MENQIDKYFICEKLNWNDNFIMDQNEKIILWRIKVKNILFIKDRNEVWVYIFFNKKIIITFIGILNGESKSIGGKKMMRVEESVPPQSFFFFFNGSLPFIFVSVSLENLKVTCTYSFFF